MLRKFNGRIVVEQGQKVLRVLTARMAEVYKGQPEEIRSME